MAHLGCLLPRRTCPNGHALREAAQPDATLPVGGMFSPAADPQQWIYAFGHRAGGTATWFVCSPCSARFVLIAEARAATEPPRSFVVERRTAAVEPAPRAPSPRATRSQFQRRRAPRVRMPSLAVLLVQVCGDQAFGASLMDVSDTGVGLLVRGTSVEIALAHRRCCVGQRVHVDIGGHGATPRVPCVLVHAAPVEAKLVRAGITFATSTLTPEQAAAVASLRDGVA